MGNIIVGLDLGTSNVRTVIGEITEDNKIEIIGTAQKASAGLRNGIIVNRESAMECIKSCIEEAEQKAGYEVYSCVTAIGGQQVESQNSTGFLPIASHGKGAREITKQDIKNVIDASNSINIPYDRKMLHVIPQNFIIDGNLPCKEPLGNLAVRLEAEVLIITTSKTAIANITQCIERAGYSLDNIMLKTLASMHAVMDPEERDLGSIIIDLGGGTTDAIVINKDAPVCTVSIPVGGNLVTNDIAVVKGVSAANAEKIKIEDGCCWLDAMEGEREVIIPGAGGRPPEVCTRSEICEIIEPRMQEIFTMIRDEIIDRTNLQLSGNIILTGGGALMPGVVQLAESVFGTTAVRIGVPGDFGGIREEYRRPDFATAVGLVNGYFEEFCGPDSPNKKSKKGQNEKHSDEMGLIQKFFKKFF